MRAIADSGFVVAFGNRNDRYHDWAIQVAQKITEPLLTCDAVLAESAFHLQSTQYVLSLIDEGLLRIGFDLAENMTRLAQLASHYEDRRPDLADLCLVRMSELFPKHVVVTIDQSDFRIYRRNQREVIPILCPPQNL